jgi:cytoskeleton protein RodZ
LHNDPVGLIGETLAEARTRRAVDLEDVHAATGIRPRYLRAIEEEDWGAMPEDFYVRAFIRKYAQFLGVAPEPLVEEYRQGHGAQGRGGAPTTPFARTTSRRAEALRRRRRRQEVYTWVGGAAVLIAVIVGIVLVLSSSGGGGKKDGGAGEAPQAGAKGATGGAGKEGAGGAKHAAAPHRATKPKLISLAIEPTAEVWACVEDAKGKPLVDGRTLAAGEAAGPFHSRSYTAAFGNGSVEVRVDGKRVRMPASSDPVGIAVDRHGKVKELPGGKRPSCE